MLDWEATKISVLAKQDGAFQADEHLNIDAPVLLQNQPAILNWKNNAAAQLVMCTWAGSYKKKLAATTDGRAQEPVWEGQCDALVRDLQMLVHPDNRVDPLTLSPAMSTLVQRVWQWGQRDKNMTVERTPNGLPMFSILVEGEVQWLLVDTQSLLKGISAVDPGSPVTPSVAVKQFENMHLQIYQQMKDAGCVFYTGIQRKSEMLFVPAGFWYAPAVIS